MKITLLQINPTVGDLDGNAAKIKKFAAKAKKADLIVTSELALLGYPPRDLLLYPEFIKKSWLTLEKIAKDTKLLPPILVGTVAINKNRSGRPLSNVACLIHKGRVQKIFLKSLLPTYDVFDEDRYFEPTDKPQILTLKGKKIGISICEDLWNDRDFWHKPRYHFDPIQELAKEKVDLIVNLSSSPFATGKQKLREAMIKASAQKYKLPILYVNQVGGDDELIFDGASHGFGSNGDLIARAKAFEEDLLIVDTDNKNNRVEPYPQETESLIFNALVLGLKDYVAKCDFTKAIIGLSGGIDSALTAAIAASALGSNNVTALLMPSPYSSKASIADAIKLAENLKIKIVTISIEKIMNSFDRVLAPEFKNFKKDVAEENIQARIRGNLLMALSNKFNSLVLSTGNKSELTVGYTTIYGDMTGGLAVIGDLTKTQVYELTRWLNRQSEIIPVNILKKAPSAELKPNQKDQDTLPPYDILDKILYLFVEKQLARKQIIAEGFEPKMVEKILKMIKLSEFKRRQAPPVLKVSSRAFGQGWRMPIASHFNII